VPVERFQIFVAAALAVLALAWFVPERPPRLAWPRLPLLRPKPGVALLLLALIVGPGCAAKEDSVRSRNSDANKLYESAQFAEALDAYQKLLAERPDLPEIAYNTGNTLDRLGQFDRAVQETRRALPPTTTQLGAATYYALGNHYLGLDQLSDAYEAYKSALLLDPGDKDAKYNLEVVLLLMNQQNTPQQQQGQQQDGQPDNQQQQGQGQTPQDQDQPSGGNADQGQAPSVPSTDTGQPTQPSQADVRRQLEDALRGLDQEVSFDDAVRILDLLNQLRQQSQPGTGQGPSGAPDY
jgi:tetratricopeptide (TPR) repeat protein